MAMTRKWTDWLKKQFLANQTPSDPRVTVTLSVVTPPQISDSASRDRRRARRRRRRSRDSIVGLPLYSADPNDAEMTLVKSSRPSLESLNYSSDEELEDSPTATPRASTVGNRARSSSSATTSSSLYPTTPSLHPPIYGNDESNESSIGLPLARSLPIEITPRGESGRIGMRGRLRASTFRSIFSNKSTPTVNEEVGRSPYGQFKSSARAGNGRLRSASVANLTISGPLQHTLVSSSFTPPRAGLTAQQVAFISSRESLGSFGYGPGSQPPAFLHSQSYSELGSAIVPPRTRANRSNSVGSPLRDSIPPIPTLHSLPTLSSLIAAESTTLRIETEVELMAEPEFLPLPTSTPTERSFALST